MVECIWFNPLIIPYPEMIVHNPLIKHLVRISDELPHLVQLCPCALLRRFVHPIEVIDDIPDNNVYGLQLIHEYFVQWSHLNADLRYEIMSSMASFALGEKCRFTYMEAAGILSMIEKNKYYCFSIQSRYIY